MEKIVNRKILHYILLIAFAVVLGLFSRSEIFQLPNFIAKYSGDILWALMIFLCFCAVAKKYETKIIVVMAIVFSFAIEFSQMYHAPWVDILRHTILGGLILGFGFKLSDLVCYSTGIFLGAVIDTILIDSYKNNI